VIEHGGHINSLAFSKVGNLLYSAGDDNRIVRWNIETGKEEMFWLTTKSGKKQAKAYLLEVAHSDKYLFAAVKSTIKVWDLKSEVFLHFININRKLAA